MLLDNLYACGEVSGDGWTWSTQGMADAYVERNVPYHYSNRGRKYDFEGQNNGYITGGFPAKGEDGKPLTTMPSLKNGAPPIPDVANTGRNLWDMAREAGISIRNYGFFLSFNDRITGLVDGPDNYPAPGGLQPPGHDLAGVTDIDYRRFDLRFSRQRRPLRLRRQDRRQQLRCSRPRAYGKYNVPSRFSGMEPRIPDDARQIPGWVGRPGPDDDSPCPATTRMARWPASTRPAPMSPTTIMPWAKSCRPSATAPIWSNTAIFIIEDDAQSGADHVDAHRTTGFVISPWIKANSVDHHFCNTDSLLKTIELILGLRPMSQYDAVADPIMDWNGSPSNLAVYDAIAPSHQIIDERNPEVSNLAADDPRRKMALESEKMDFTHPDAAPALELDQIVWKTIKGPDSVMPIMHRTLPGGAVGDGDDDDN